MKKLTPGGCLPLPRGYIHEHNHYFQTSSPLKPLGQSMPNFMWSLLGKWERKLYKRYRSHDQDGRHAHLWQKPSKLFYRTNGTMIMKLCMEQYVLKLNKVYINDDHELTLTHFKTMSNLAKRSFVLTDGPDIR